MPRYLEDIRPSLSAEESIRRLCFQSNGALVHEFDELFASGFENNGPVKRDILMALVSGSMTVSDISRMLGKKRNGHLSAVLDELTLSGFVERDEGLNPKTGRAALAIRYRLKDNYVRFYLKCIEPNRLMIERDGYRFASLEQLEGWDTILGLQFENLVLNHLHELLIALNIERNLLTSAAPYRFVPRKKGDGVQIDLLIQAKRFWYVVEIKRRRSLGREVIEEVNRKVDRLPHPRFVSIRTALVYEGELSPVVPGEGYFDAIIPIDQLLGRTP